MIIIESRNRLSFEMTIVFSRFMCFQQFCAKGAKLIIYRYPPELVFVEARSILIYACTESIADVHEKKRAQDAAFTCRDTGNRWKLAKNTQQCHVVAVDDFIIGAVSQSLPNLVGSEAQNLVEIGGLIIG